MESYSDRKESITFPTPGDDFYQHVNGRWLETVQIPPSEAIWGSFPIARDRTVGQLREIAASLRDDGEFDKGSPEQKREIFIYQVWIWRRAIAWVLNLWMSSVELSVMLLTTKVHLAPWQA